LGVGASVTAVLALALTFGNVGSVSGDATYYAYHPGQAAAGRALRLALGPNWRGKSVNVTANGHTIRVRLTDAMGRTPRLIDLDPHDFAALAPLSQGVLRVVVSWGDVPTMTLPPTDTERTLFDWLMVVK
jgi:hypothetical protein